MNESNSGRSSSLTSSQSKRNSSSTIESSVTRLLVSTKHLLESLTQWTRQEVDDKFVSDAYVKLGNDFRAAVRAFSNAKVDVSDIGDVPKALRIVLESALSEPPTQESLDRFLPNIRSIIVNLLQNLKQKQLKIKGLDEDLSARVGTKDIGQGPLDTPMKPSLLMDSLCQMEADSNADIDPGNSITKSNLRDGKHESSLVDGVKKDALRQLQESRAILRRASKRFSAYQFAKLANANKPGLLPLTDDQTTKIADKSYNVVEKHNSEKQMSGRITVFLLVGEKTKKVLLEKPITMASLRLCFVEKFAYSPGSTIFPDIYIEDKRHLTSYELEEHLLESDVNEGVSLSLRESKVAPPAISESKLDRISEDIAVFFTSMKDDLSSMSSEIKNLLPIAKPMSNQTYSKNNPTVTKDLDLICRDIKAVKQVQNVGREEIIRLVESSRLLTAKLKESSLTQPLSSNRHYMENSYAKLSGDSDFLLTKVDDLLDMMEALRKDVAQRGVRIGEKQLKNASNEIEYAKGALSCLRTYIGSEKPMWKRIWEKELDKVCEEQQFLTLQDDLTLDLVEDIKKIEETFDLIKRCSSQQSRMMLSKRTDIVTRMNLLDTGESLHGLKDAMLSEVASLIPNHSTRLEAIARAERIRNKERELMGGDQFQEELGSFVSESRLRKSGGIDELEKSRREKDSENLRLFFGVI